ncbi:MAG TPA: thymidine phosphorylase [Verrucomicrobiae bacterium]|nr:thymidine phosphorylase [Verrucomicrobiae bacterium]
MNLLPLIKAKRDGQRIPLDQIKPLADAVARDACQPEQVGALLMAIYWRGMDKEETRQLTLAMRDSGEVLTFPADDRPLVDKHSTGGVGDKVSLILAPLLAALGLRVPMISGRGLGITGGTLDKMESIPGCRTRLSPSEIVDQVQRIGCVICGQTEEMIPADRILYAMRDVTGTISSIPLITSSILSKKLAENIGSLLLDVKFGRAAFMKSPHEARELAFAMTHLGRECGINVRALMTDMETPLGTAAGNWLEVKEVVECLDGNSPNDLEQLVVESAAHLLEMCGRSPSHPTARAEVLSCLNTSAPRRIFDQMIGAQGADLEAFRQKLQQDSSAPVIRELKAARSGYVARCDAKIVGEVVHGLGGGRTSRTDAIQPDVGIDRIVKPGHAVEDGVVLARVHADNDADAEAAMVKLKSAFTIQTEPPELPPLIFETVR